jgi:hypothetical protein
LKTSAPVLAEIEGIQRHLEAIYCLDLPHRASDFVIGDQELDDLVQEGRVPAALVRTHEQLFVSRQEEGLSVALYLSDTVREQLRSSPSLQSHCHATEGVSHFLMLLWATRQNRPVRLLDLELQAEVDKASTCLLLDFGATGGDGARELLDRLFASPRLEAHLSDAERERYLHAHRLAARYARYLSACLQEGVDRLLSELRLFYRLSMEAKRCRAGEVRAA